ncbi:MAG: hypothetical protein CW336_01850 [Bacteroidetes bacterium]|nr:hypothetical protein [Bacteroidota bacterium]
MVKDLNTTITIKGMSGADYIFNVYGFTKLSDLENAFKKAPALYAFTRRFHQGFSFSHDLIFVGETGDLSSWFNRRTGERFMRSDANCICIHSFRGTSAERQIAETDIQRACDLSFSFQNL